MNKSQQLEGFLNEQINLNDDDKSTLSILLNEFESNSCDLSELLNNLLQHVLAKMTNPMSKHRLLSLIKSIYIEPLIEAATQDGQPDDTCESINGRRLSMNSAGKLQLDLRLFEAMIQRYLIASRVLQADESMLFNPIKPSCRPDDYYLPSSQAAIKLESTTTTRETNDNRHPSENLITSPAIQTTNSNNNNNNNLASPVSLNLANQTGRHLSQNVTPMELPEIGIECARNAGRRSPVAPKQQQQQLARRNLSWLESRHNNHDHLHGGHQTTAEGLPLQFSAHHLGPANSGLDTNQLEAIYLNDDDEHLEDFMLVAPTETNKPNNNNNFVSIKNQQDKHDKDYLLPIQQQQQQQQRAAQSSPPDVPDMRGREQVNELNLSQPSHLNDNNQAALTVVQRPPYHQHAEFSRYQNNCGGVQGEGERQRQLECSPSNLVNLANHRAESTIARDFNGLLGAPDEPNHPNHPNQASQRPLDVRHPLGLSASSSSSSLAPVDHLSRPATFASPPDNNHVGQPIEGGNLSSFDQHHNHHHRQRPRQFAGSPSPTQLEPPAAHLDRSWASLESLDRLAQAAYQLDGPPPPPLQDNINSAYLDFNQNNNVIYEPRLAGAPSHPEDYFSYPAGQQQRIRTSSMGAPHANYHNTSSSLDLAALARPQTDDFGRQWQPERDDTPSVCSCLECLGGQARYGPNSGAFLGLAGRNYQGQQQQQLMSHPQHPQHLQQQQQQQQRCQSSMSMPNSGNWNQANWNEQQQPPFNTNIPSSHNGRATLLAPSNWAARRPASHLLSNQQVVGGQQTSEPHRHQQQQQRRPQPQHRSLSSSSGSQLRTYEHEHDHRGQVKSHHHGHHHRARHRKRHQAARGRQLNYRDEQQRPASGDRTYLDDEEDDEDDDDDQEDDDGQPTCVSLVPSQAKGRLPMSVAEQVSCCRRFVRVSLLLSLSPFPVGPSRGRKWETRPTFGGRLVVTNFHSTLGPISALFYCSPAI